MSARRTLVIGAAVIAGTGGIGVHRLTHRGEAVPVPARHVVEVRQLRFHPPSLNVSVGDTITWINRDVVPHTATATDGTWDSGELGTGASWQWIVPPGETFQYVCLYHINMRGTIVPQ